MTLLVVSIPVRSPGELPKRCQAAWERGADAIELRLDYLGGAVEFATWGPIRDFLSTQPDRTWILTIRTRREGGLSDFSPLQRARLLTEIAAGKDTYLDFERRDFENDSEARAVLLAAGFGGDDPKLILSRHHLGGEGVKQAVAVEQGRRNFRAAEGRNLVFKDAFEVCCVTDSLDVMDFFSANPSRQIAIAMNDFGQWTRVFARKVGAFATFAALDDDDASAPGQIDVRRLKERFRWDQIGRETKLYGVIGDPVAHSLGPLLFNHWFSSMGVDAVYLPFRVLPGDDFQGFLHAATTRPELGMSGFSVTVPHKEAAWRWVRGAANNPSGDMAGLPASLDRNADGIGAVNTIAVHSDRVFAFNTDCHAALQSLVAALGVAISDMRSVSVDVLGAGGAARAVISGLRDLGVTCRVFGRNAQAVSDLVDRFGCEGEDWTQRHWRKGEVVINTTSVGMWPLVDESPLSSEAMDGCRLVFDLIYRPAETKLLADARRRGIAVLNGLDMFIRQAAAQFALWTGREADQEQARELLHRERSSPDRIPNDPGILA